MKRKQRTNHGCEGCAKLFTDKIGVTHCSEPVAKKRGCVEILSDTTVQWYIWEEE